MRRQTEIAPPRREGRQKVTGQLRYVADTPIANLAHAVLVQSTIAHGRITAIDTTEAEAVAGVLHVMTYANAPRLKPVTMFASGETLLPLQDERIHYSGQHVAVVVAETLEQASQAAALVQMRYAAEPAAVRVAELQSSAYDPPEGSFVPARLGRGDLAVGLAAAAVQVEATYTTQMQHHNPLETGSSIALWNGDRLTVYDSTQSIGAVQATLAATLGLPPENVRVLAPFVGGGFGSKSFLWPHTTLAALAARVVGRPVKLVVTRTQLYSAIGNRPATVQQVRLGADDTGRLTAIAHRTVNGTSPYDDWVEGCGVESQHLYACPNVAISHQLVRTNLMTSIPMRSPAEGVGLVALEGAMDELAERLGLDPLELRVRNFAERDPASGLSWSSNALLACYRQGAQRFGWAQRSSAPRSMREGAELIGWGMASALHPDYMAPARARARIAADGGVLVQSGTNEIGTGTFTVMAQLAAQALGVSLTQVQFALGDTRQPTATPSFGSMTAPCVGTAVYRAGQALRALLIERAIADPASPLFEAVAADLDAADGRLFLRADPTRGEGYRDLMRRQGVAELEATGEFLPPSEPQYAFRTYGAHFVEVRVDELLGRVRVTRVVSAIGAGRVLNERTARSQVLGGVIWGIGQALMEQTVLDQALGKVLNANFWGYYVPVNADAPPEIEPVWVEFDDPHINVLSVKGIGEITCIGVEAAVANAVAHATGRRVRDLPITIDKLL
jgi:xanthine dehydrogenase YagR molybdenum-binding subunit